MRRGKSGHKWAVILLGVVLPLFCAKPLPVMRVGGDFTLTDDRGAPFDLKKERGRVILLFFGFAHCPDFCPNTLTKIRRALDILPLKQRSQVRMIMVTVDPERDTPERLRAYLSPFKMEAVGLTGSLEDIQRVAKQYGAMFQKSEVKTSAGYMVDHSPYVYLIDQQGKVRHYFRFKETPDSIAATVKRLF